MARYSDKLHNLLITSAAAAAANELARLQGANTHGLRYTITVLEDVRNSVITGLYTKYNINITTHYKSISIQGVDKVWNHQFIYLSYTNIYVVVVLLYI